MPLSEEDKKRIYEEERIRAGARFDHSTTPLTTGAKGCALWYRGVTVLWVILAVIAILFAVFHK